MSNDEFLTAGRTDTYDRHPARSADERVLFPEGVFLQGADLNEALSQIFTRAKQTADLIAKDGDRLEGADVIVDAEAGTVAITAGRLYLNGASRHIPAATLSDVPMVGDVDLGVYVTETVITSDEDPSLLGLHAGTEGFEEPGAIRTRLAFAWGRFGDGTSGQFYGYLTLRDGVILSQDAPPTLSGVAAQIAAYDLDANGNYIVSGCVVSALGKIGDAQHFSVDAGTANVMGVKVRRPSASRHTQTEEPDLAVVDAEPHTWVGAGATTITVRRAPIAAINTLVIEKQRTVTITKGVTDSSDTLPDDGVTSIVSVVQGGTTYVATTDYVLSGDAVSWAPGGAEPSSGSSYDVTYRYLDAQSADSSTDTTVTISDGVDGGQIFIGYDYKLPRVDRICLGPDGGLVYLKGIPAFDQPQPPARPTTVLSLATVYNDWMATPVVENNGTQAFTNDTVNLMFQKIVDLSNLMGLERLNRDLSTRAPGTAAGIFADPLTSDRFRDAGEAQTAAVFDGSMQIAIDPTWLRTALNGFQTLAYDERITVSQPLSSGCTKINPYQTFQPLPARLTINPAQDFWVEQESTWLSPATQVFGQGNQTRVTNVQTIEREVSRAAEFLRQITINYEIRDLGAGEIVTDLTFDGIDVHPGSLVANGSGVATGSFVIPQRVAAGRKLLRAESASGRVALSVFTGRGTVQTVLRQTVTTVERFSLPPRRVSPVSTPSSGNTDWSGRAESIRNPPAADPQAQAFALDVGRHVSSIDIKFCLIGNRNEPVVVEIVTMDNGFPTTDVIAQTEVDMNTVSVGGWTNFRFDTPVYLPGGVQYAFVVKTNDANHSILEATLGQFDAASQRWITAQPYTVGERFSSSNAVTWTPHPASDLTFRINTAAFNPTSRTIPVGTFAVTDCSDLIVGAEVIIPEEAASCVFRVKFGSEPWVTVNPNQVIERTSFFTGNVVVEAVVSGNARVSPILFPDILVISGTMRASGTYVSRVFPMGNPVRLDSVLSTLRPSGATIVVEADAGDDNWQAMPQVAATPIDDGFVERTYRRAAHAAALGGRLKITLTGTPAARPSVADLRAFSI
jgi:hypothetical protein